MKHHQTHLRSLAGYLWHEWSLYGTFFYHRGADGFSGGLRLFKARRNGFRLTFYSSLLQQKSAEGVSSKRKRLVWGDSRKFSLSSGSSEGAAHLEPEILSRMMRAATESGLRQSCHSQGWVRHSAALGRSLWIHKQQPCLDYSYQDRSTSDPLFTTHVAL